MSVNSTNSTTFIQQAKLEQIRNDCYSKCFFSIFADENNISDSYIAELRKTAVRNNLSLEELGTDFPNKEICNKITNEFLRQKNRILNLFDNGDLLNFSPRTFFGDKNKEFNQKYKELEKKLKPAQYIISTVTKFGVLQANFAFFSDGTIIYVGNKSPDSGYFDNIIAEAKKIGISNIKFEKCSLLFIDMINEYARYKYINTLKIADLPDVKTFVKEAFNNYGKLISATADLNAPQNVREFYAIFENGKVFTTEYSSLIYAFNKKINIVMSSNINVPQEYITALYDEAKNKDYYAEPLADIPVFDINSAEKENELLDEIITANCLSLDNYWFSSKKSFLFDNGILIYSTDYKQDVSRISSNVLITEAVDRFNFSLDELKIYVIDKALSEKILTKINQKTITDIYTGFLKEYAKKYKTVHKISHAEALDKIAQIHHFKSWRAIYEISDEECQELLNNEKEKHSFTKAVILPEILRKKSPTQTLDESKDLEIQEITHNQITNWIDFICLPFRPEFMAVYHTK